MRKNHSISVIVLGFLLGCIAQSASPQAKAQLVDEFSEFNCEVLWSRLDSFMGDISRRPDGFAVVEVSGKVADPPHLDFYWYEMIRGYFRLRQLANDRWQVRRTGRQETRHARFWLVPPGAPTPEIEEAEWPLVYPPDTKPFILTNGENYSVTGNGTCLDVDEIALLEKALAANPGARVNVVLITPSERAYRRLRAKTLRMLTNDYSINPSRIRTFWKPRTTTKRPWDPEAEYWFVPAKERASVP